MKTRNRREAYCCAVIAAVADLDPEQIAAMAAATDWRWGTPGRVPTAEDVESMLDDLTDHLLSYADDYAGEASIVRASPWSAGFWYSVVADGTDVGVSAGWGPSGEAAAYVAEELR